MATGATITFGPSGRGTAASGAQGTPAAARTTPGSIGHAFTWVASLGLPVLVAGALVVLGSVGNGRTLVIVGGLAAVALPTAWILVNAISRGGAAVPISQIQIGAYGCAIAGFMTLILAAIAIDTRVPSVR